MCCILFVLATLFLTLSLTSFICMIDHPISMGVCLASLHSQFDSFCTSYLTLASSSSLRPPSTIFCCRLGGKEFGRTVMRKTQLNYGKVHNPSEQTSRVDLKLGLMDAYVIRATESKGAALLLLTDVYGYNDEANQDFVHRLSRLGYTVLVPDLFHGLPWDKDRNMDEYEDWRSRHPSERVAMDVDTAATWLKEQETVTKVGLVGFCFGGGRVLEALARDDHHRRYATAVSFYPTRFDSSIANQINVPVLLISGDMDQLCSPLELSNIASLIKDSKCQIYPGRGHAFVHRPSAEEIEDAFEAFLVMETWLSDKLLHGR